jgi:hypothetical protein
MPQWGSKNTMGGPGMSLLELADDLAAEDAVRSTRTLIRYLSEGSFVNRRFVSAGEEYSTGQYEDHEMTVRDGRAIRDRLKLDVHGFQLADHVSGVADFRDKDAVEAAYPDEACALVKALTGADAVVARGWMVRTSGELPKKAEKTVGYQHYGGVQPPAGEAHVDFTTETAHRIAEKTYRDTFPDGPGYSRFLATSLWRTFSPPPQDWPLALCDGRSLRDDEGVRNTLHIVDEIPSVEEMTRPMEGEDQRIAASVFRYSPAHRWWYFSGMTRDEALMFKFFDSDHSRTWRCPHTAFHDVSMPNAHVRESIEFRSIAFFA